MDPAEANTKKEKKNLLKNRHGKILAGTLAICAVMTAGVLFTSVSSNNDTYAVSVNGRTLCAFESKEDATEALNIVVNDYTAEDSSVKAVAADAIEVSSIDRKAAKEAEKAEPQEAAGRIEEALEAEGCKAEMRIASSATEVRDFTPEPDYKKDESMLAGQSRVESEAEKGQKEVKISYVTVNGEVADKTEEDGEVLEAGKSAVIYKGTRGLPEGEDWRTYEGDPISVIGGDLGETALSHLGVPYSKWDCVDLVRNVYREMGITLPRSHKGIRSFGVGVSYENAKKGDIICYSHHVGIYLGNGKMVHSISAKGVTVGTVDAGRILTVRRYVAD